MKKLWVVTVETEMVVVAEDEDGAEEAARDAIHDVDLDYSAGPMTHLPCGWDGGCLPYGEQDSDDPDRTIDQWADLGAAEAYRKLRDKVRKIETPPTTPPIGETP